MTPEASVPPIASPHGSGAPNEKVPQPSSITSPLIPVHLSLESALRSSYAELLYPGNFLAVCFVAVLSVVLLLPNRTFARLFSPLEFGVLFGAGYLFLMATFFTFWRLLFSPDFEIEIRQEGVCTHYRTRDVLLSWNKISIVLYFNGDVWIICSDRGCLIPRECFTSREQSRHFARLVRQLWESDGAAWNATFGPIASDENQ